MIFGRKKRLADDVPESPLSPPETDDLDEIDETDDLVETDELDETEDVADEDDSDDDDSDDDADSDADDDSDDDDDADEEVDHDLRDDGPFDVTEVDLDADDIDRLDFGALVLTPFEGMQVQLQVDQETNGVQTALVMFERSALEVALFAAPAATSMVREVATEMVANAEEQGGTSEIVADGPFGPEVRRQLPVTAEDGQQGLHVSRTWLTQGPKWLLRGVLMGEAALEGAETSEAAEVLLEFYKNIVVRRDDSAMVPGEVISMTLPESMVPEAEG